MKKKIFSVLISISLLFAMMPMSGATVFAASENVKTGSGADYIPEEDSTVAAKIRSQRMNATIEYIDDYFDRYPEEMNYYPGLLDSHKKIIEIKVNELTSGKSDLEKLEAIYDWVINNVSYSIYGDCPEVQPYDVYYKGVGNCFGRAMLTSYMLRLAGFRSAVACGWVLDLTKYTLGSLKKRYSDLLSGTIEGQESGSHSWVMLELDNKWYLMDPTGSAFLETDCKDYLIETINYVGECYPGRYIDYDGVYHQGTEYKYYQDGELFTGNMTSEYCVDGFAVGRVDITNGEILQGTYNPMGKPIHPNGFSDVSKIEIKNGKIYCENIETDISPDELRFEYGAIVMKPGSSFKITIPKSSDPDRTVKAKLIKHEFIEGEEYSNYPARLEGDTVYLDKEGYISVEVYEEFSWGGFNSIGFVEVFISDDHYIIFDTNGGKEEYDNRILVRGTSIGHLPKPTRQGYRFSHWEYKNGDEVLPYDVIISPVGDIKLKAVWEREIKSFDGTVTLSDSRFVYTGKAIEPAVTVKDSDGNELKSSEYTLTYSEDHKNAGPYTVTVNFKNNYRGTVKKEFCIIPKQAAVSKLACGKAKLTVQMSSKVSSKGGSTYRIAYMQKGTGKWKYVTTDSRSKTIKPLKKNKRYYVKVCAYKTVGGKKYCGAWGDTKLSGKVK